jgi:hypothetical protein
MSNVPHDDWPSMCEHWRALAQKYYEPIPEARCNEIVEESLQAIKTHKLPEDAKKTGVSGWSDSVHLDADERNVRFVTRKVLPNADMNQLVDHSWSVYSDGDLFKKAHLGNNCEFFLQVLQEISPDVVIIHRVEKYPDVQLTHALVMLFRVQTETGYMIGFRCIESPQLQSQLKSEGLNLAQNFFWEYFDRDESDAIRFTLAGSIGSENPAYAKRWRSEILAALVRYETQYLHTSLPSDKSTAEGDNEVTSVIQATP